MRETGTYQKLGNVNYFIPHPLPPIAPPLELSTELLSLYGEANFALGQLNEVCQKIPDSKRFIKAYTLKEALLSSEIEGIYTTLVKVFTSELDHPRASKETQLVINYAEAVEAALKMIQNQKLPIVVRVILKTHEILLAGGAGDSAAPGQFRKQGVQVGNLIPPPPSQVPRLMSELEKFINEFSDVPPLIKIGLVHVHFETIHPFLDGNGRIGRLLIVLMLIDNQLLNSPILYPSYYFKKHHEEYYQCLDRVRTHGDFEGWINYYLKAIKESAKDAYQRAKDIEHLEIQLQILINTNKSFKRMKETALEALNFLFSQPITPIAEMSKKLDKAYNTIQKILKEFIKHNIVSENIIYKRNKLYRFEPYIELLEKTY